MLYLGYQHDIRGHQKKWCPINISLDNSHIIPEILIKIQHQWCNEHFNIYPLKANLWILINILFAKVNEILDFFNRSISQAATFGVQQADFNLHFYLPPFWCQPWWTPASMITISSSLQKHDGLFHTILHLLTSVLFANLSYTSVFFSLWNHINYVWND